MKKSELLMEPFNRTVVVQLSSGDCEEEGMEEMGAR